YKAGTVALGRPRQDSTANPAWSRLRRHKRRRKRANQQARCNTFPAETAFPSLRHGAIANARVALVPGWAGHRLREARS
ncbi:MAG: hypothetical protein ACUVX9_14705, partial [Anaerolineae bacterium]